MNKSTRSTITESERLQLIGLFSLAQDLARQLIAVERAAFVLTGETDSPTGGHVSDAVWNDLPYGGVRPTTAADDVLSKLGITVKPDPDEILRDLGITGEPS